MPDYHRENSYTPILSLQNVSCTYSVRTSSNSLGIDDDGVRHIPALSHVSLDVFQGDFLGIIGGSGAGKTTLLSICAGAIPHHYDAELSGEAYLHTTPLTSLSLSEIAQTVGYVIEDIDAQMVALEVEEELLFGLENFGVDPDEIEERIEWSLEKTRISDLRHRQIHTLSGGQKQKVALAAMLALKPRILLLDEPTCALDPASSRDVYKLLSELVESCEMTVVVVEQKISLLAEFASRICVMDKGTIKLCGSISDVLKREDELDTLGINYPRSARLMQEFARMGAPLSCPLTASVSKSVDAITTLFQKQYADMHIASQRAPTDVASTNKLTCAQKNSIHSFAKDAPAVLSLKDVSFQYGNMPYSVKGVSMDISAGELVAICGANGAGKTTLTKLITHLLNPCRGEIHLLGKRTRGIKTSEIARSVATLFQDPDRMLTQESTMDELMYSAQLMGTPADEAQARAHAILSELELDAQANPLLLSSGERHLVAFGATIIRQPKILILDEPTSGLDFRECEQIMRTTHRMCDEGCAVVMVSHDMEVVSDYATRVCVMAQGEIIADGSPEDIFVCTDVCNKAQIQAPALYAIATELKDRYGFFSSAAPNTCDATHLAQSILREYPLPLAGKERGCDE